MAESLVKLLASDRIPPAVGFLLREALAPFEASAPDEPSPLFLERLDQAYCAGERWLSADPALAEIGHRLLDRRQHPTTRRNGCIWLTLFPSVDAADALAKVALDENEPLAVRDQAAWSLGFRQAQDRHPACRWSDEAVARADAALVQLAEMETAAQKIKLEMLPLALRHVDDARLFEVLAKAPALWGEAFEAFASPELARTLLARLDDIGDAHVLRVTRLVTATLGEEAVPALLARAAELELAPRLELLFCALAVRGEPMLPAVEEAIRDLRVSEPFRARARWHLAHPGVLPTVRGLRTARTTARLAPEARAAACAAAADDLAALAVHQVHPEAYLYRLWAWMVRGSGDPGRARVLCDLHPSATPQLLPLYLRALAAAGRVGRVMTAAQEHKDLGEGTWLLAAHGRPFAALELAAGARTASPELLAGRAVAAFRAGRPDLAEALLANEPPPASVVGPERHDFPGPDERWLVAHARGEHPVLAAFVEAAGAPKTILERLLALAQGASSDADPDRPRLELLAGLERRLRRDLAGATVYLAGDFEEGARDKTRAAVEAKGARVVAGPFPDTDFYVMGTSCFVSIIAKLERQGTRALASSELEVQ